MTGATERIPLEAKLKDMDGLEFLRAMRDGRLPRAPIATLLDFHPVEIESGRVVFAATPNSRVYNPLGTVHGGYVCTLLDSCMGCAVHSTLKAGQGYTSVELKVSFVRPLSEATGEVRAEGKVLSAGRQIATAEGRLVDAKGRLLAHGTTTCLVFPLP
jgi:uncharacterized protein (TIGR00369 family)